MTFAALVPELRAAFETSTAEAVDALAERLDVLDDFEGEISEEEADVIGVHAVMLLAIEA